MYYIYIVTQNQGKVNIFILEKKNSSIGTLKKV